MSDLESVVDMQMEEAHDPSAVAELSQVYWHWSIESVDGLIVGIS